MTATSSPPPSLGRASRPFDPLSAGLLLLVCIGELPLLLKFFADLWTRPQYDFFPLILIGATYLAWDRIREQSGIEFRGQRLLGTLLMAAAFLTLALGAVFLLRWLGGISAWIALAGCVCWIGGVKLLRTLAPSFVLLMTILPPPGHKDEVIALNLRQWAVWASGRLLDLVGIAHVSTGSLINIAGHRLGVEDACSGLHSLLAVVAVTLMLGFYWRRPAWRIVTLMCCSLVFVVWANVLRIALGAYLIERWKFDILAGSAHELLGLVLFMVCIALTASLDQFLVLLRPEPPDSQNTRGPVQPRNSPAPTSAAIPNWMGWAIAGAFLLLGAFTGVRVAGLWAAPSIGAAAKFSLPATVAGWQRVDGSEQVIGRPEVLGQYSFIWTYRNGPRSALVACDFPFPGYHELATCYLASGWQPVRSAHTGNADQAGPGGAGAEMEMQRPSPAFAYLLYGCCDEKGRWLAPETLETTSGLSLALQLSYERARAPQAYQVQVLLQGFKPPADDDKQQLRQLFFAVRDDLAAQLARQAEAVR